MPVETTKTFGCSIKWSDKRDAAKQAFEKWAQEPVALGPIDLDGVKKLLKNDTNKLRLINIWASWCGPCVAEFPDLVEINRMYRGREFEMVGISVDSPDAKDKVQAFLDENQASYPNYLYDGRDPNALIDAVDPKWEGAIPYTLVIKPGGAVLYQPDPRLKIIELPLEVKKAIVGVSCGRTPKDGLSGCSRSRGCSEPALSVVKG